MIFPTEKTDRFTIITLPATLDKEFSKIFKQYVVTLHNQGVQNVILDMQNCITLDSSGLSSLLVVNRLCTEAGGVCRLINTIKEISLFFQIAQLDQFLQTAESKEIAVACMCQ